MDYRDIGKLEEFFIFSFIIYTNNFVLLISSTLILYLSLLISYQGVKKVKG